MSQNLKRYLFWFANEHLDFRVQEIISIANLFNINIKWSELPHNNEPYNIVEIDSDESVKKIASRSVLLRYAIDLWAQASSLEGLHTNLKSMSENIFLPYSNPNITFKIKVEIFGSSQTQAQKVAKIESFNYLPLSGSVKLKDPTVSLQFIEYYSLDNRNVKQALDKCFFGRLVAEGQRDLISKHSLKSRAFIGNTSMDPQLALIMANQAQIKEGDIVLDPFVGTGSLLVAAAEFGGCVIGADIDYLMVHGKTRPTRSQDRYSARKDESIINNLRQYGLKNRYLDVIVADSSLPFWRPEMIFDVIITDPPYGIREALEKVGSTKLDKLGKIKAISEDQLKTHIPSKIQYCMSQLLADLLSFSVRHLPIGGKLVTWVPVIRCEYSEEQLPRHECLKLEANSEHILSTTSSRRLLTYTKIRHSSDDKSVAVEEEESFRNKYQRYVDKLRKSKKSEKNNENYNNNNDL